MGDKPLVHIVDDEEAIRKSTSFMLTAAGYAVETWPSGTAFLKAAAEARPGCVLLDVRMPDMDGLEVQQALTAQGVAMPVIVLTGHGDVSIAVRAMKAGAVDFIEKPFEQGALIEAIETGLGRLRDADTKRQAATDANVRLEGLTARERDVLAGLADGMANKVIANHLGISPRTVEIHRANLMAKLEVRSLSDALRIAFAAGMGTR
jgi:two-component system, LuxR family, response regulator FixJ